MILEAMQAVDKDARWVALSPLGKQLNAVDPSFDPRNYGCRNLSTLLKEGKGFEVKEIDGTLKVRSK